MTELSKTQIDWLDALVILRRGVDSHDVKELLETKLQFDASIEISGLFELEDGTLYIAMPLIKPAVRTSINNLPKIERVEMLLYAASSLWFNSRYPGDAFSAPREAFVYLCQRVGCYWKNTPDVRERWRLIDYVTPAHLLPVAQWETRPKCTICSAPVATGAGGMLKTQEYLPQVHEECLRYAHRVLAGKEVPKLTYSK